MHTENDFRKHKGLKKPFKNRQIQIRFCINSNT